MPDACMHSQRPPPTLCRMEPRFVHYPTRAKPPEAPSDLVSDGAEACALPHAHQAARGPLRPCVGRSQGLCTTHGRKDGTRWPHSAPVRRSFAIGSLGASDPDVDASKPSRMASSDERSLMPHLVVEVD